MPLNSSGSSSSVGARRGGSSNLLVMVGLVAVVMFMAIFSIHSSFSWHEMDEKATASVVTKTSHEDFKRLMDQTKQLLNDMAAANSTLTLDTLRDFKALTLEEKRMGEQNEALEREVDRLETALTHCLKGKYDAETSLDTCKREFKDYQGVYNKDTASAATKTVKCPDVPVNVEPPQPPPAAVDETKWLVIGIPTVARRNDLDYLLKTLAAMVDQLPLDRDDPLYRRVLVHVINMQVNSDPHHRHVVFDQAKGLYGPGSGSPYAPYFKFSELLASEVAPDPVPGRTPQNDPGTPNLPGFLVRRQTRNIAYVMQRSLRLAKFYLFLEDDMMLCPQGFHAIAYLLRKASRYHPHWLAIRASYGMNGIFMHDEDLATFAAYLLKHQKRRPPDHLVVEWYAGETPEAAAHKRQRKNVGFKFNLFDHLGVISTLRSQQQTSFPRCYDLLIEPTVFQVEAYSPVDCPRDDVWPCANTQQPPERVLIDWAKVTR